MERELLKPKSEMLRMQPKQKRNQHVTVGGRLGPGKARENTELLDEFAKIGDNKNVFIALKKHTSKS